MYMLYFNQRIFSKNSEYFYCTLPEKKQKGGVSLNLYDTYTMRNGSVLVAVNGYEGEEDFYLMHNIIKELLTPEDEGYSVDSMCVGGYLRKDGLLIRTSSESPYDCCSFFYNPTKMQPDEVEKVKGWIEAVINELHNRKKPA